MTGAAGFLPLAAVAAWAAVWPTGRHLRSRIAHRVSTARESAAYEADTRAAYEAELLCARVEAAARAAAREARSVALAAEARACRPLGTDVGVLR